MIEKKLGDTYSLSRYISRERIELERFQNCINGDINLSYNAKGRSRRMSENYVSSHKEEVYRTIAQLFDKNIRRREFGGRCFCGVRRSV